MSDDDPLEESFTYGVVIGAAVMVVIALVGVVCFVLTSRC